MSVLARYFVPNAILLDGIPLEPNVTKWSIINCSQNDPCGIVDSVLVRELALVLIQFNIQTLMLPLMLLYMVGESKKDMPIQLDMV